MLFNSFKFLVFFPVVTIIYFILPFRFRWFHLLAASCLFYAAFIPAYIIILFGTIIIDYFAGIMIESSEGTKRKLYLVLSLVANIGILCVFKYYNFFISNINELGLVLPLLNIILPIGLSFHTFQAMSYTIEVYRGNQKAERHFGIYALYVMFYPQLVAGPIERPQNVLHQFHEEKFFNYDNVVSGLRLMLLGLFKKIVIADRLATYTDPVFNNSSSYAPVALLIAVFFFTFQIFCDFSGYSDIALGSARVMGFKLMRNFDKPYHSKSLSEFWRRWHISLSTWFRDYLYISLGGNRVSVPRWYFNLFFVFLISGFWHGANWTFIIWGALHGFYLIVEALTGKYRSSFLNATGISKIPWLSTSIQVIITFSLIMVSWTFFRANTVYEAIYILQHMPQALVDIVQLRAHPELLGNLPLKNSQIILCFALIAVLEISHIIEAKADVETLFNRQSVYVRWGFYYCILAVIFLYGVYEDRQFIYFQF